MLKKYIWEYKTHFKTLIACGDGYKCWLFCCIACSVLLNEQVVRSLLTKMGRARPGFEPGTSRTRSENHTPRPTSQYAPSVLGIWTNSLNQNILPDMSSDSITEIAIILPWRMKEIHFTHTQWWQIAINPLYMISFAICMAIYWVTEAEWPLYE